MCVFKNYLKPYTFLILLASVLCFSSYGFAESLSGECGAACEWALDTDTGKLVLTGSGRITSVPWKNYKNHITEIEIGDDISGSVNSAFAYCPGLQSVKLGNCMTEIAPYSFSGCTSLYDIRFGTAVKKIGACAFDNCTALTDLTVPDTVTVIDGGAFGYCSSLETVLLSSSLTTIGNYAFSGCSALEAVSVPNSVTLIGNYAFSGCSGMESLVLGSGLTLIGNGAFEYCSGLKTVSIPGKVTQIGEQAFNACTGLEGFEVDPGNRNYKADDSGVLFDKAMQRLIQYPSSAENALYKIPDTVETVDDWAFYNSSGITYLYIPSSVIRVGYAAFYECDNITKVLYEGGVSEYNEIVVGEQNGPLHTAGKTYNFVFHRGDTDFSGAVNIRDITTLRRYIAGGYNVVPVDAIFDIDSSGEITVADLTVLRRYIAGGYGVVLSD